ncbi:hypothetical protein STXM2123_1623 [Streptomyces sp. F-3]|nr:hypothetical protein STXM2123_1623 [Streptomyces sp. F-3]
MILTQGTGRSTDNRDRSAWPARKFGRACCHARPGRVTLACFQPFSGIRNPPPRQWWRCCWWFPPYAAGLRPLTAG